MPQSWFRRAKRGRSEQDAATEPAAPRDAPEATPPLRLRHLLLLNLRPSDGPAEIESAPPLGASADVVRTIQEAMPGIRFNGGQGEVAGEGHRVTIDLGPHDPVAAAVVAADGGPGMEMLRALMRHSHWRLYAPRAGMFIEPESLDLFARAPGGNR